MVHLTVAPTIDAPVEKNPADHVSPRCEYILGMHNNGVKSRMIRNGRDKQDGGASSPRLKICIIQGFMNFLNDG